MENQNDEKRALEYIVEHKQLFIICAGLDLHPYLELYVSKTIKLLYPFVGYIDYQVVVFPLLFSRSLKLNESL